VNDEMTYTSSPFERDFYYLVGNDEGTATLAMAATEEDGGISRIAFFETEAQARDVADDERTPEGFRGNVSRMDRATCEAFATHAALQGTMSAIVREDGLTVLLDYMGKYWSEGGEA
jgi:hypothetical protein